jgi:DNA-binding response OmpR family regulator
MSNSILGNLQYLGVALPKRPLKVLVIEDDKSLVELLEVLFDDEGYQFSILHYAKDILQLAIEFGPDIILLDYILPHINGGELCRQLRISKECIQIPVIIFSAYPKNMMALDDQGYDAFIEKPFELTHLIAIIEDLGRKHQNILFN